MNDGKLIEILERIHPGVDYASCEDLIDGHVLDSLTMIVLVAELEDAFDVSIPASEIVPDNFNSAAKIGMMLARLAEEG